MRVTEVSDYYGSNASHYGIRGIVLRSFTTQTLPWNDLNLYVLFVVHKVANVFQGCLCCLFIWQTLLYLHAQLPIKSDIQ